MSGRKRGNKQDEWRRYTKFKEENQKLKKEVSKLRKQLKDATQIDQLSSKLEAAPKQEVCPICGNSDLNTLPIKRQDGEFKLVICNSCGHRSNIKKDA